MSICFQQPPSGHVALSMLMTCSTHCFCCGCSVRSWSSYFDGVCLLVISEQEKKVSWTRGWRSVRWYNIIHDGLNALSHVTGVFFFLKLVSMHSTVFWQLGCVCLSASLWPPRFNILTWTCRCKWQICLSPTEGITFEVYNFKFYTNFD